MQDQNDQRKLHRWAALLGVLTREFQDRTTLLAKLGADYPSEPDSARKTFERDIAALGRIGFRISKQNHRPPRYALFGHPQALPFDQADIMTLSIIRDTFGQLHPYSSAVQALLQRLVDVLLPEAQALYHRPPTVQTLFTPATNYAPYHALIADLEQAITDHRMIHFAYQASDLPTLTFHRKVDPYEIEYYERHFYLVGYSFTTGRVQDFRIDRIRADEDFGRLPHVSQLPRRRGITFSYRLSPTLVRSGISQRFQEQRIMEHHEDGGVVIEARGRSEFFVIQTMLRYRGEAEILSPPHLREQMRQEVQKLLGMYESK